MTTKELDQFLHTVLAEAGVVILEAESGGSFTVLSAIPIWFSNLVAEARSGDKLDLRGRFPFLDHFLHEAKDHWAHGDHSVAVRSGLWVEEAGDNEVPMEATARQLEDRSLLILQSPSDRFRETKRTLRQARQSLLENEVLEQAVAERTKMIREREEEIAVRLVSAAEFRDAATGEHIRRIGRFTTLLATVLRVPPEVLEHLDLAAAMHDVGKIGIPDHILLKPGRLDDDEWRIMQGHTTMGGRILAGSDTRALQIGREIALYHHEKWDGTGYPHGLAGEDIPLVARIVAVVDFFDALVNDRPYRPAVPPAEVLDLMAQQRGKHFDPEVLDLFLLMQPQIAQIRKEVDDHASAEPGAFGAPPSRPGDVPLE